MTTLRRLARKVIRPTLQRMTRIRRPVDVSGLRDLEPASRSFGLDRGTPIDRYYIEQFLTDNCRDIAGRTLEVADSTYTRKFGRNVASYEVLHVVPGHPDATVVGDLADAETLPEDWIDCFVCTQTLQFVFEIQAAVRGIHRVLRPGGIALVTLAGISPMSRFDMERWGDYWRCTSASMEALFVPVFAGGVQVTAYGNRIAATGLLNGLCVEDLPDPSILDTADPHYQVLLAARVRK